MTIWKMGACPRCGGDLFLDKDIDGWCESCLQCGHYREQKQLVPIVKERHQRAPGKRRYEYAR
jgi:reverse gyrase